MANVCSREALLPSAATVDGQPAIETFARPSGPPLRRIELFFIWGFWAFIALLTFANAIMNDSAQTGPYLPAAAPLVSALVEGLVWAILTPVVFKLTSRFSLDQKRWLLSVVFLLALGLMLSVLVSKLMAYVRFEQANHYRTGAFDWAAGLRPVASVWFMNEFIIYLVIMTAGFAHDYFFRYRKQQEQAVAWQTQAAQMRAQLADARLSALRTQLNPHFLFNTLNTVSSLVEYDTRGAQRMIARLSELLRETLLADELEVSLDRELAFIRRYIDIMQTRFQGRLKTIERIDPETLVALVPNLILQPLVENAIKHGIGKRGETGRIEIRTERVGDMLRLSVVDNGSAQFTERLRDREDGTGLGLRNTRARLLQSYGENQSLSLRRNEEGGVIAEVILPFHSHARAVA